MAAGVAAAPPETDQRRHAGRARRFGPAGAGGGTPTAAILVAGARAVRGTGTFRHSETGGNLPRRLASSCCRRNLPSFCASSRPGQSQTPDTRRRRCASVLSTPSIAQMRITDSRLAGVPSPSTDPTIGAFRHGIRRVKHAARGPVRPMFRSEIPAPEMPPEASPRVPAAERLSRRDDRAL